MTEKRITTQEDLTFKQVTHAIVRMTVEGLIIGAAYLVNPVLGVTTTFGFMGYELRSKTDDTSRSLFKNLD